MDRKVADATAISPMASNGQKGSNIDIAVVVDQIPGNYLNPMATR